MMLGNIMMLGNMLILALDTIRRNLMRSALTILGVVIGVAAVITMVTLGKGATATVTADISSLGSQMLTIWPGRASGRGPGGVTAEADPFELADVEALAREVPGVAAATPVASSRLLAVAGNANWSTTVRGTDNAWFEVHGWDLAAGRAFTEAELRAGKMACVLGQTTRAELFGDADPLGARMRLGKLPCTVVGLLGAKGEARFGIDRNDVVMIPIRAFHRRIAGDRDVQMIEVLASQGVATSAVEAGVTELLRQRRRVATGAEDDFLVHDMREIANTLAGATRTLTLLLSAVAAVSLLVGGIGIMNIMLVSVTERTREIGTRLAIGALEREVLSQFLVEAVVLSSLGGVLGIVVGLGGSAVAARAMGLPFIYSTGVVLVAFGFSAAVGVVFGLLPARKAAVLDPIDALRHE